MQPQLIDTNYWMLAIPHEDDSCIPSWILREQYGDQSPVIGILNDNKL